MHNPINGNNNEQQMLLFEIHPFAIDPSLTLITVIRAKPFENETRE